MNSLAILSRIPSAPPSTARPLSSDEIRARFTRFWLDRGSLLVPSSSLIPLDDPTVLLTTAGMQQFTRYFLGQAKPPSPRLTSIQKCFRTSDIEEVGDRSHLTFFEMLGNFSVGDYFKQEVIPWALEFVTQQLGFPIERLWVTVHTTDDEAEKAWIASGFPRERIVRLGDEHNWWGPPGLTGPCGPDSEIYYAQGPGHGCGFPEDPPGCDCGRVEFWNLVFMQYFQDEHGVRTELPSKNVDTGLGLERCAMLAQAAHSVYDTDLYLPIVQAAARIADAPLGRDEHTDYALRVLADHGRGMTFLVADGVVPGASGREYVLRRVMRRAIRFGRQLGIEEPFLGRLVDAVVARMDDHYPELRADQERIRVVVENEEELFNRTLRAGTVQIERIVADARAHGASTVTGQQVFDLYQTYGFPPELTAEALREEGLSFDWQAYRAALEHERTRAQGASGFAQQQHAAGNEFPDVPETELLAWTASANQARILAARVDGVPARALAAGTAARLILEASAFYPEGGGQVGDTGRIVTPSGIFRVDDTRLDAAGHIVHMGQVEQGAIEVGGLGSAQVDLERRGRSMRHHTATHLLHRALKDVLGEGTSQQGSYVGPDQLRFDFNYPRPLAREQLERVGQIVNDRAMQDLPVHWEIMDLERARSVGAVMMFGEKYGERVRVVSIGDYSKELCGGTHTHHAGELGVAVIAAESGIGSGKRRIVAYAGQAALDYYATHLRQLERLAERAGAPHLDDAERRLEAILEELEQTRRELARRQHALAHDEAGRLAGAARDVRGTRVVASTLHAADEDTLRQTVDVVRERLGSGVVALGTVLDGKPRFVVGVTRDLVGRGLHAGRLLGEIARAAGGGGGGRPDFATGGGRDVAALGTALDKTFALVDSALGAA